MNRVNPLHVGALLFVVLIFVVFKLNGAKETLLEEKNSYNETSKVALELNGLKKAYERGNKAKKELLRVLSTPALRSLEIQKEFKKSGAKIAIKSIDKRALNLFMGKILNAVFIVDKVKIKRLSEEKASLEMELKW